MPHREPSPVSIDTPPLYPTRYVTIKLASQLTGYTNKAIARKIERGDWPELKLWRHAPDGRVLVDLHGYLRWVERG